MIDEDKTVPEPGEAHRDRDEVHYFEVDETNVRDADRPQKPPPTDGAQGPESDE